MALPTLDGPRVLPTQGTKPDALVVLLHGYGSNGDDLIALAPHWQRLLPTVEFISPHAPERCMMAPIGGMQWFPITGMDPQRLSDGVRSAAPTLDAFLDQELERAGLTEDRLALVGFSQGTMMALHVGLRRKKRLAGIVGYSGALPDPDKLPAEVASKPPVLLIHGDADQTVPLGALHAATAGLGQAGVKVVWHVSKGVAHGIAPDGLTLGGQFLAEALGAGSGRPSDTPG